MFHYQTDITSLKTNGRKVLNIFDFDGTLFSSPKPNPLLFSNEVIGRVMSECGWFVDQRTLSHPFIPIDPDESWWHQETLDCIDYANINILMTGRRRDLFLERISQLARHLKFDLLLLKETNSFDSTITYNSTFNYKVAVIDFFLQIHPEVRKINLWDDRMNHCNLFSKHFMSLEAAGRLDRFTVVHVEHSLQDQKYIIDSELEIALVKHLVNECNKRALSARTFHHLILESLVSPLEQPKNSPRRRVSASLFREQLILEDQIQECCIKLNSDSQEAIFALFPQSKLSPVCSHILLTRGPATGEILSALGAVDSKVQIKCSLVAIYKSSRLQAALFDTAYINGKAVQLSSLMYPVNSALPVSVVRISAGGVSRELAAIKDWEYLSSPIHVYGHLSHTILIGLKNGKLSKLSQPSRRPSIKISQLLMKHHPELKGPMLGKAIRNVDDWIQRGFLEDIEQNRAIIESYICSNHFE